MSERRPHILFFSYHLPKDEEPGAFRPLMEARLLKRMGFEVTVVTSGVHYMTGKDTRKQKGWCTEEFYEGIRVLKTWAPSRFRLSILRRLLNYLSYAGLAGLAGLTKVRNVDRVFAATPPFFMMPISFLVSRLKRAELVLDERDLYPETAIALGVLSEGRLSRFLFRMQQFFRREACQILTATPGIRQKLLEYGCPRDKVQFLYNADIFMNGDLCLDPGTGSLKEQMGVKFLVGYAGGLGKANDISTLLRAVHHLQTLDGLGFVIIGTGESLGQYRDYCRENGLHNVLFTGPVSRTLARSWLCQLDVCVHLYPDEEIFEEALASKIFDYFGVGKPVVFCGRGETAKLLAESGAGLSLEPEDDRALAKAIQKLWQDEPLRRDMGRAAKCWFEEHVNIEVAGAIIRKAMDYGEDQTGKISPVS